MKRSKFSEEHIVNTLRQVHSDTLIGDVCRQLRIAEQTFYVWKKYAHLSELCRLRQLKEESTRRKRLVADLSLDNQLTEKVSRNQWPSSP